MKRTVLADKRIGTFGKGGCGKSIVVVLPARALHDRGYEVCVVDADSTNIGLHRALGLDESPRPLLQYFGGTVFSGGAVTCPVDDPRSLPGATVSLAELPEAFVGRSPDGIALLTLGKIGGFGPGAGCDGPISKIARDLRIRSNAEAALTLIDFKAGFEDSARGVVTSLDWALVVVDPTEAAMQMAVDMTEMIDRIKAGELPATRHLGSPELVEMANRIFREAMIEDALVILNRVLTDETEEYMRSRLAAQGIDPIGVLHEDPRVAASSLSGTPLDSCNASREMAVIVERLETLAVREMERSRTSAALLSALAEPLGDRRQCSPLTERTPHGLRGGRNDLHLASRARANGTACRSGADRRSRKALPGQLQVVAVLLQLFKTRIAAAANGSSWMIRNDLTHVTQRADATRRRGQPRLRK